MVTALRGDGLSLGFSLGIDGFAFGFGFGSGLRLRLGGAAAFPVVSALRPGAFCSCLRSVRWDIRSIVVPRGKSKEEVLRVSTRVLRDRQRRRVVVTVRDGDCHGDGDGDCHGDSAQPTPLRAICATNQPPPCAACGSASGRACGGRGR